MAGAIPLLFLMLAVIEWSLANALELGSANLSAKLLWANIEYLGIVVVPVMWLLFAFQYTGKGMLLTRRNLALLASVPLATLLMVWTNDFHGLMRYDVRLDSGGPFSVVLKTYGTWFWVLVAYSYVLLLVGTIVLMKTLFRPPRLYRGQAIALLIGVLSPWIGNALYISGLSPIPRLDITPCAFAVSSLALALGLFRSRLLDIIPVARETLIEVMDDGMIVVDAKSRLVDLNKAAERIIGRTDSETVGHQATHALPHALHSIWTNPKPVSSRTEVVLGESDTQHHYNLKISPLRGGRGRLCILQNITEQKEAQAKLKRYQEHLQELVEERTKELSQALENVKKEITRHRRTTEELRLANTTLSTQQETTLDAILVVGKEGKMSYNQRFVDMWGIPPGVVESGSREVIMQSVLDNLVEPVEFAKRMQYLNAHQNEKSREEVSLLDGRIFDRYSAGMFGPEGKYHGRVWYFRDITAEKRADRLIREQNERLKELDRMKSEFLSTAAHELRTPLTSILGFSEILLERTLDEERRNKFMKIIHKESKGLTALINDLLDVSGIESGRGFKIRKKPTDLGSIIRENARLFRSQTDEHTFKVRIPKNLPKVQADPDKIDQVLENLLSNAVKFSPKGGEIVVTVERNGEIRVSVADQGMGIPKKDIPYVFRKFYRAKNAFAQAIPGTGLGLGIAKYIVEAHGGEIFVNSRLGKGSVVTFSLPIKSTKRRSHYEEDSHR